MKVSDLFRCERRPERLGGFALVRHSTVDAPLPQGPRLRARDTVLTAETAPHDPRIFARRWVGNLQSDMEGLTAPQQKGVLEAVKQEFSARYGNSLATSEMRRGPDGSLRTDNPKARPEKVFGEPVSAADVQKLHDEANAKRQTELEGAMDRRSTKDTCAGLKLGAAAPISDIQRAWDIDSANRRAAQTR